MFAHFTLPGTGHEPACAHDNQGKVTVHARGLLPAHCPHVQLGLLLRSKAAQHSAARRAGGNVLDLHA